MSCFNFFKYSPVEVLLKYVCLLRYFCLLSRYVTPPFFSASGTVKSVVTIRNLLSVTVVLFDIPTNSVEQRRSCVLRNCLADQEFPLLLWNSSVHKAYRVSTSSHWSVS